MEAAGLPSLPRRAWLEVDLAALAANLAAIRSAVPRGTSVAAVVKGDGYGHGLEASARTFAAARAEVLGVATVDEGLRLRAAGITHPVIVLFTIPVGRLDEAVRAGLEVVASDGDAVRTLLARWRTIAPRSSGQFAMHLEIETGLGRAGVRPDQASTLAHEIATTAGATLAGVWSHLASPHDPQASAEQVRRFDDAVDAVHRAGVDVPLRHLAASGGILAASSPAYELVRPGLALYGELGNAFPVADERSGAASGLRPALALKARPIRLERVAAGETIGYGGLWRAERPSLVATLPVGYGDGYARAYGAGSGAEGTAQALVRGARAPIVGSVAMDAIAVDVTDVPGAGADDEYVLLGAQGRDRITTAELARLRTTIVYEVLTALAPRLPRVYHAPAGLLGLRTLEGESASSDRGGEP